MRARACIAILAAAVGCSSSQQSTARVDEFVINCEDTDAGVGVTSDENFDRFIEAEASNKVVKDPCKSPELTAPGTGAPLDPQNPPTFTFNDTHACATGAAVPVRTGCRSVPRTQPAYSRILEAMLSSIARPAEAHCGAITGPNYYFKLTRPGDSAPAYSAMLSVTSYVPDAQKWQKAMSGRRGQTLTLVIERAVFLRGDINEGPYVQPQAYTFTVGP